MKTSVIALLLAVSVLFSGCTLSRQPENQAYAVTMSLDLEDDGQITLAVQVPTIGAQSASGQSEGGSGGGGSQSQQNYVVYAAAGASFPEALDLMQNTVSHHLRLMQLKTVVFGEKLARSGEFARVVDQMMRNYNIYGAAFVVVCVGSSGREFLEKQQPSIGIRLSSSLAATLEHYFMSGYVAHTSLFSLYALNHSIYSDPVITVVANAPKDDLDKHSIAPNKMGEAIAGEVPRVGNTENEYMGGALIRDGRVVDLLNGMLCQWLAVLNANVSAINYMCEGTAMQLNVIGLPRFTLKLNPQGVDVALDIAFECLPLLEAPNMEALRLKITSEIQELITRCQSNGVEPFNLSELAAGHFLTVPDFQRYQFREKFCAADVRVSVDVKLKSY